MHVETSPSAAGQVRPRILVAVFLCAVAIRWLYSLVLYATMGERGLMESDAYAYLSLGRRTAEELIAGSIHGWQWLGSDLTVMPLATWLFAASVLAFGPAAQLGYVLVQGLLDAGTCLMVYGIARSIKPGFALPAAIAAALNPTQIVIAGYYYTDTPFLFFATLSLYAAVRWLREPGWRWAALAGIALGVAALCRVLIVPWTACLVIFLFLARLRGGRPTARAGEMALLAALVAIAIAPLLARNLSKYGELALTPQSGTHLAFWVVPLVKEAKDGTPWGQTSEAMQKRSHERYGEEGSKDLFQLSRERNALGREALAELGLPAMAKAWVVGTALNLGAPAIILSPPVAQLPRTGFYSSPGASAPEKIFNFLFRSDNPLYGWALLVGLAGVALVRLLQAIGLLAVVMTPGSTAILLLLLGWIGYILAVNGPVASPKYRLPIEAPLMVGAGAGLALLLRRKQT